MKINSHTPLDFYYDFLWQPGGAGNFMEEPGGHLSAWSPSPIYIYIYIYIFIYMEYIVTTAGPDMTEIRLLVKFRTLRARRL